MEEASYIMDRPPGGWSDLVTNRTLDLKFAVIDDRFARVDGRFASLEARMEQGFATLERCIDTTCAALGDTLRAEMERGFRLQTWRLMTTMIAMLGVIVTVLATLAAFD